MIRFEGYQGYYSVYDGDRFLGTVKTYKGYTSRRRPGRVRGGGMVPRGWIAHRPNGDRAGRADTRAQAVDFLV